MKNPRIGLVVFGESGSGKSTLCNTLIGAKYYDQTEETFEANEKEGIFATQETFVIDTKGYIDSDNGGNVEDPAQFKQMIQYIKNNNIRAFILTMNIHNPRISYGVRIIFELIYNNYPSTSWFKHIAIVWTRCYSFIPDLELEKMKEERKKAYKKFINHYFGHVINEEEINSIPHYFIDSIEARKDNSASFYELCNLLSWAGELKLIKEKVGDKKIERRQRLEYGKTWTETLKRRPPCFGLQKRHSRTFREQIIIYEERTIKEFTDGTKEYSDWKEIKRETKQEIINSW